MLKRLRFRFILLNMVLAALVLVVAFATVCYIDYQSRVREVYDVLSMTLTQVQSPSISQIEQLLPLDEADEADRDGQPGQPGQPDAQAAQAGTNPQTSVQAPNAPAHAQPSTQADAPQQTASGQQAESADTTGPATGRQAGQPSAIPTADASSADATTDAQNENGPYTSTVQIGGSKASHIPVAVYLVKPDGVYTALSDYASASIPHSLLLEANKLAQANPAASGELKECGLFYEKRETSSGTLIAYADVSNTDSWQSLAWTLTGVGACVLIAFLIINAFFSWWALRPVEFAWKQQTQFVTDASHELKTPLTVIMANTAILRAQPEATADEQAQWLESTQTEAERMLGLVNDMLDLARPKDAAQLESAFTTVDFTDMVEAEALQFESVAFERGITLECDLQQNIAIEGSPERLQRLVSTLIDNACKYADESGQVDVTLSAKGSKEATLKVRNTGNVIAPEDLPHVFDRFYRADKARTSSTGGYGLGLAIAKEIAQEHEGEITVSSNTAEGTAFTVKLPLANC